MGCGASAPKSENAEQAPTPQPAPRTPKQNLSEEPGSSKEPTPEVAGSPGLTLHERILLQIVPGDLLARKKLTRKELTSQMLIDLRSGQSSIQMAPDPFPACTADTDQVVVDYEKRAASLAGGSFNAEPGEGKTPPADQSLVWERGYLLGDEAHEIVPVLLAQRPGEFQPKPVAILLHGTGSSKEKMIPHLTKYANQGFLAVSMDHRYLGERSMNPLLNEELALTTTEGAVNIGEANVNLGKRLAVWPRLSRPARLASYQVAMKKSALGESLEHPFVFDSAWDVLRLVDYLATRNDVKKTNLPSCCPVVGLMGVSLGGMVTQLAAAADTRIRAAAPMISLQCFDLQKNWKMWAPRVKTLQIPFKAVAERDGCKVEDVEGQCATATQIRNLRLKLNEEFFEKLGVKDQMQIRDNLVAEDDQFMREMGVDETVVEKVYGRMNPGLLDGDLDGPQIMRALAPRPLLITNAAAGQRCPAESIYEVFQRAKNEWTKHGKGNNMRLYLACQPILHHSDREDLHMLINKFLLKHVMGDDEAFDDKECDDEGKQVEVVPGQTGWMFSGKDDGALDDDRSRLTFQEQVMTNIVPGDVLERFQQFDATRARKKLTSQDLKTLRGTPNYLKAQEPFPELDNEPNLNDLCVEIEKKASALAGGEFNAEPGEGKVPPADAELHWERGYLVGEAPHEIIPLLIAKQKDDIARPAMIMLHGTGSSKEKMIPHLTEYAKAGFLAISMDHRYLGERSMTPELVTGLRDSALYTPEGTVNLIGDGRDRGFAALALRLHIWPKLSRPARLAAYQVSMKKSALGETLEHPFVFDSAWDVIRVVDYLATRKDVKKKGADPCVGLWGISLGGMVTQLAAASDVRIQAAAPMIAIQCFELQRDWKMWAPRCKTLQIPFKAMAQKMDISPAGVEEALAKASEFRKTNVALHEDFFDHLGIKDQILGAREELIAQDDRFMRELGVDERVVTATWRKMNPELLDFLDGPKSLQAIAPRPLLMCNAGAGQRCPVEATWDVFKDLRDLWHHADAGEDLLLYVACQPMVHHAVAPDFLAMILQFMRRHLLGVKDTETAVLSERSSKHGSKLEPVDGYSGVLFRGDHRPVDF